KDSHRTSCSDLEFRWRPASSDRSAEAKINSLFASRKQDSIPKNETTQSIALSNEADRLKVH
ncbi:hypothetical protein CUMW_163590, partial [Citrus unshiu]